MRFAATTMTMLALVGCSDRLETRYVDSSPLDDDPVEPTPEPAPEPPPEPQCAAQGWTVLLPTDNKDFVGSVAVSSGCDAVLGAAFGDAYLPDDDTFYERFGSPVFGPDGTLRYNHQSEPNSADWGRSTFDNRGDLWTVYDGRHDVDGTPVEGVSMARVPAGEEEPAWREIFRVTSSFELAAAGPEGAAVALPAGGPYVFQDEVLNEPGRLIALLDRDGAMRARVNVDAAVWDVAGDWFGHAHALLQLTETSTVDGVVAEGPGSHLMRLAPDGSYRLLRATEGFAIQAMATNLPGRMVVVGVLNGAATLGDGMLTGQGPTLVALDEDAKVMWQRSVEATGLVAMDDRGHVYLVSDVGEVMVTELNANGDLLASTSYPDGGHPEAIAAVPAGGLVIGGATSGLVDYGFGEFTGDAMYGDLWIASLPPAP